MTNQWLPLLLPIGHSQRRVLACRPFRLSTTFRRTLDLVARTVDDHSGISVEKEHTIGKLQRLTTSLFLISCQIYRPNLIFIKFKEHMKPSNWQELAKHHVDQTKQCSNVLLDAILLTNKVGTSYKIKPRALAWGGRRGGGAKIVVQLPPMPLRSNPGQVAYLTLFHASDSLTKERQLACNKQ